MTSKKNTKPGYYNVSREGCRFKFTRNVNGMQVTINMPEQHLPGQEKQLKEQIIELIGGEIREKNGGV